MLNTERQRLQAANRFLKLEISKEPELRDLVLLAATICQTPTALLTLVDQDGAYQTFKIGTPAAATVNEEVFCKYVMGHDGITVIPDTQLDRRFANTLALTEDEGNRFYAGVPLKTYDGLSLGVLSVIDTAPRELSRHQIDMLQVLSKQAVHILELDRSLNLLKDQFEEAKNVEIKLRSFFENSRAIHVLIGREQEILTFNKAGYDFVKAVCEAELTAGIKAANFIEQVHLTDFVRGYEKALGGEPVQVERQLSYGSSAAMWWSICYNPAFDADGEIIGVSFTCTDINERKNFEERMMRQNEMLRKIAYVQSHEFRRPVASILGLMNVIKLEGDGCDHKESLRMMEAAVLELDEKIHDIVNHIYAPDLLQIG